MKSTNEATRLQKRYLKYLKSHGVGQIWHKGERDMSKQNMDWFMEAIRVKDAFREHKPLAAKEQGSYIVRLQRQMQALDAELKIRGDQVAVLTERCDILTERLAKTNEALGKALAKAAIHFGVLQAKNGF